VQVIAAFDPSARSIAGSILALAMLTFLTLLAMEVARALVMRRDKLGLQSFERGADARTVLPRWAMNIGDNYNHLFEVPTVFYAIALLAIATGLADPFLAQCAWIFVALRIAHTLVQTTINRVVVRFPLFFLSWIVLVAMVARLSLRLQPF
jgi:hypothetical protein